MRAIELKNKLDIMFMSGEITNDTEIVIELSIGGTQWRCEPTRVVGFTSSDPEFLAKNEMLKPQMLVLTGNKTIKI